jgi:hypothetical protein
MTQKFSNLPGSSSSEKNKPPVKKVGTALFFSGIFVALSFIVMFIPLALFNVTQVAAMLGKRVAFFLMLAVSGTFLLFGSIFSQFSLLVTGFFVLGTIPFFISAIAIREAGKHWLSATFVLFIPVILMFGFLSFGPPRLDHDQFSKTFTQFQKALKEKSQTKELSSFQRPQTSQVLSEYVQKLESSSDVSSARDFFGYTVWQRVCFFIFGAGSSFFLLALVVSFANVVLVDFGFEQIERLRAIANYVKSNPPGMSAHLGAALLAMPMVRANRLSSPLTITQHSAFTFDAKVNFSKNAGFWSFIWKPLKPQHSIYWQGYSFSFQGKTPWDLRSFSLPFGLALFSIAFIGSVPFWCGNFENILVFLEKSYWAPYFSVLSLFSFVAMTVLALQGMCTLYKRVSLIFIFLFMAVFLLLGSKISLGPYTVLAVFGAIGLLDDVYNWRGKNC